MGAIREIKQKYFGEGDLEAFFGLFGDVFSKIAAIIGVLYFAEGFPADIVMGKILPGIGVGSIAGSLIYFWEAYDLGKKEGRTDVTALPFGVSSTQVFAWIYLIIVPIYRQTGNALHAWQVAVAACFLGGLVEIAGGFVSKLLMKWIPNAALMGNMAAGALVWLSLNGFVTVFETPLVSVIPLFLIFLAQKMKKPLIKGIPNTVLIVGTGVALAWLTGQCNIVALQKSAQTFGVYPPQLSILDAVMVNVGQGVDVEEPTYPHLAETIAYCDSVGLPVCSEPVPGGFDAGPEFKTLDNIARGARIACEIGCDFMKVGYAPGFERIVDETFVPLVVLGGAKTDNEKEFLASIKNAMDAGASGVAIGRNVWGGGNTVNMTRALAAIIHKDASVDEAYAILKGEK